MKEDKYPPPPPNYIGGSRTCIHKSSVDICTPWGCGWGGWWVSCCDYRSCNGWPSPLCGKGHVYGRALNCLMLVRHLRSSCLVSCWSYL